MTEEMLRIALSGTNKVSMACFKTTMYLVILELIRLYASAHMATTSGKVPELRYFVV